MDDKEGYSSKIAAEAVGERLGSPPPDAGEQAPRPAATSAGPQARVADKTAESVGERAGDAYADATPDEARERSLPSVRPTDVHCLRSARPRLCRGFFDSPP
jgi:hypothetical protein